MSLTLRHSATSNVSDHSTQAMQNYSIKNVWKDVRQTMIYQFNSLVQGSLTLAQQTKTFVDMITCWPTPSLVWIFTYMLRTTDALVIMYLTNRNLCRYDNLMLAYSESCLKIVFTHVQAQDHREHVLLVYMYVLWLRYPSISLLAWLTVL